MKNLKGTILQIHTVHNLMKTASTADRLELAKIVKPFPTAFQCI
jgi:hypothetical protein